LRKIARCYVKIATEENLGNSLWFYSKRNKKDTFLSKVLDFLNPIEYNRNIITK